MRALKITGIVAGVLLLLLVAAGAALVAGGAPLAAKLLRDHGPAFVGRDLDFAGLSIDWGRPTRIVLTDARLANAEWGSEPHMFTAGRLALSIDPMSLLRFKLRIPDLAVENAKLLLETSQDGKPNWQLREPVPEERSEFPDIYRVAVNQAAILYRNGQTGAETTAELAELSAETTDRQSPVKLAGRGTFNDHPFDAAAELGALNALQDPDSLYPIKLDGTFAGAKMAFEGNIAEPLDLTGIDMRVAMSGEDLKPLLDAVGLTFPKTPPFALNGVLRRQDKAFSFEELETKLGRSTLTGSLTVGAGEKRPFIQARLASPLLDVADFKGFIGEEPGRDQPQKKKPENARILPAAEIPFDKLQMLDAEVSLEATRIQTVLPVDKVKLAMVLRDGTLTLQPLSFAAAKGEIRIGMTLASTRRPPTSAIEIDLRHLDLDSFAKAVGLEDKMKGRLGGFAKLSSAGGTTAELLREVDGDIGLFMDQGQFSKLFSEVVGLDVAEAVGFLAKGDRPHPINCFVARFEVANGVATAATLLFDTTDTTVLGRGNVNLADETLFLDLVPQPKDPSPLSLRTPIHIRGTFNNPEYQIEKAPLAARLGAAIGLGVVLTPLAALLPMIETGLGEQNACAVAYGAQKPPQRPPQQQSRPPANQQQPNRPPPNQQQPQPRG